MLSSSPYVLHLVSCLRILAADDVYPVGAEYSSDLLFSVEQMGVILKIMQFESLCTISRCSAYSVCSCIS